jgi:hypothetical protein
MRTTVVLDDALFQEATKAVLADWLSRNEPAERLEDARHRTGTDGAAQR